MKETKECNMCGQPKCKHDWCPSKCFKCPKDRFPKEETNKECMCGIKTGMSNPASCVNDNCECKVCHKPKEETSNWEEECECGNKSHREGLCWDCYSNKYKIGYAVLPEEPKEKTQEWEIEFDKKFTVLFPKDSFLPEDLKQFIKKVIDKERWEADDEKTEAMKEMYDCGFPDGMKQERERISKIIEGRKMVYNGGIDRDYDMEKRTGYNKALEDILKEINK